MKQLNFLVLIITFLFISVACQKQTASLSLKNIAMKLTSPYFINNSNLPAKFTCDGESINPSLEISAVPSSAQSLVLISDDPDAPAGNWVHWLVWNIDPKTTKINENSVPVGAVEGRTSFGKPGYGAPCPPSGTHRYYFKVYALNTKLELDSKNTKADLEQAMQNHVLDSAEIIGLYQRIK